MVQTATSGMMNPKKVDINDADGNLINPAIKEKQDVIITELQIISGGEIAVIDTPEFFEDTNFVTGDSPVTLDLNTALGRNARSIEIQNDGPGNFTYSLSNDGSAFGDEITLKVGEIRQYTQLSIDSVRITWITNSAYRVEGV